MRRQKLPNTVETKRQKEIDCLKAILFDTSRKNKLNNVGFLKFINTTINKLLLRPKGAKNKM